MNLTKILRQNRLLWITGLLLAKNLTVEIETDFSLDAELVASLNKLASGKLDFSMASNSNLKMLSSSDQYFPIAVKAYRIDFDKNIFQSLTLITDNRTIF